MIRAMRTLPILLLAMTLGVSQACACAHGIEAMGGARTSAQNMQANSDAHAGHGMVHAAPAPGLASDASHEDACGTSAPDCDHAPDGNAVVVKASADLGSKLAHPAEASATATTPVAQRESRDAVGQTGPPPRAQDPLRSTPVSLKVRLLN